MPRLGLVLMVITSLIWGFTFVPQKSAMLYIEPYWFNALRFVLGGGVLLIVCAVLKPGFIGWRGVINGVLMGCFLFLGAGLQQVGLVETTAGKAAFITGLYIILVPLFMVLAKRRIARQTWFVASVALLGLYFLTVTSEQSLPSSGDAWVLLSAVFWALHILAIDKFSKQYDPLQLAITQFLTCALFSAVYAGFTESLSTKAVIGAAPELLFAGIISVAIAYTLQMHAQKLVEPHLAALILSLEAVFGAAFGIWLLNEALSPRMLLGAALMTAAIVLAQLKMPKRSR